MKLQNTTHSRGWPPTLTSLHSIPRHQVRPRRRIHGRSCRPVHAALPGARQCLQAAATTQVSGPALLPLLLAAACCGALLSRLTGRSPSSRDAQAGASDAAVNHPALATAEAAGAAEAAQKADLLHSATITGTSSLQTSPDDQTLGDLWRPEQHTHAGAHVLPAPAAEMSAQAQQIWRLAWHPLDRPANRAAGTTRNALKSQPAVGRRLHGAAGLQTAAAASSSASGGGRTRTSPPAAGEAESRRHWRWPWATIAAGPEAAMPALASIPGAGPSEGFEEEQAAEAAMHGVLQGGTLLQRPQLALQGLRADARAQLLAVALAAIQQHIQTLPAAAQRGSGSQWELLAQAVLASSSVAAATAWLGYCPPELQRQAAEAVQQLPRLEWGQEGAPLSDPLPPDNMDLLATLQAAAAGLEPATAPIRTAVAASPQSSRAQIAEQSQSESAVPREQQQAWQSLGPFRQARRAARQPKLQQGSAPAAPQLGSLWEAAAEKAHLHAVVMRFVRFSSEPTSTALPTPKLAHALAAEICSSGGEHEAEPSTQQISSDAVVLGGSHRSDDLEPTLREQAQQLLQQRRIGVKGWSATRPSPRQRSPAAGRHMRASADTPRSSGDRQAARATAMPAAPAVLQDMAVCAADAVAACYLAEARDGQEGGPAQAQRDELSEGFWPALLHPRLTSTRALERFRNQVALQRLMAQAYHSVAAMYEDRHFLWGLAGNEQLLQRSMPARRAKELASLSGWRYFVSLCLEAADVMMPLVQNVCTRLGDALSWLLVRLIGRALGLVFKGIKQSLAQGKPPQQQHERPPQTSSSQQHRLGFGY